MVQAILEGRKTMTRRVVKPQPDDYGLHNHSWFRMSLESELSGWHGTTEETGESREYKCPYGDIGDILWVRETWSLHPSKEEVVYKADGFESEKKFFKWKPSIFMPKGSCRIKLEIIGIRVERLQDISNADAIDEGIRREFDGTKHWYGNELFKDSLFNADVIDTHAMVTSPKRAFRLLWKSINGKESWDSNPWVWVIEFKRLIPG